MVSIVGSVDTSRESWIARQPRRVNCLAEDVEELILMGGNRHITIGGAEHAERAEKRVMVALRSRREALNGVLPDHALAHGKDGIDHRDVDELPDARAARMVHGRETA